MTLTKNVDGLVEKVDVDWSARAEVKHVERVVAVVVSHDLLEEAVVTNDAGLADIADVLAVFVDATVEEVAENEVVFGIAGIAVVEMVEVAVTQPAVMLLGGCRLVD